MTLTNLQKLSSAPIFIPNVGHLKSPTLYEIAQLGQNEYGQNVYNGKINILLVKPQDLLNTFYKDIDTTTLSVFDKTSFTVWSFFPDLIHLLLDSLSFFFADSEFLLFDKTQQAIIVLDIDNNEIGKINNDNFNEVISVVKQLNYIGISEYEQAKPKNRIAEKLIAKMQKAEQAKVKDKSSDVNLANIISALSVSHNSYNLTNIWSLTVFQLYDQFLRQNIKNQIDISALKWGAWGSEPFDFELWYKSLNN